MSVRQQLIMLFAVSASDLLNAGHSFTRPKSEPKLEKTMLLVGSPFMAGPTLTVADAQAVEKDGKAIISMVAPIDSVRAEVFAGKKSWMPTFIRGVTVKFLQIHGWNVSKGRMWTTKDETDDAMVCVIGTTVVSELFGSASPLGKTIRVDGISLKVIGTLARRMPAHAIGLDQDDVVLTPLGTLTNVKRASAKAKPQAAKDGSIGAIYVRVKEERHILAAVRQISTILRKRHRIRAGQADDFEIRYLGELVTIPGP